MATDRSRHSAECRDWPVRFGQDCLRPRTTSIGAHSRMSPPRPPADCQVPSSERRIAALPLGAAAMTAIDPSPTLSVRFSILAADVPLFRHMSTKPGRSRNIFQMAACDISSCRART